jgi:hypothetical protein
MGSLGGRTEEELGSMATLGGGETICGDGISVKVIQRGLIWNEGVTGRMIRMVKAEPGSKVLAGAGESMFDGSKGVAALGSSWLGNLGCPWDGMCWSRSRDGAVGMMEFNRVRDDLALGITLD